MRMWLLIHAFGLVAFSHYVHARLMQLSGRREPKSRSSLAFLHRG
jgi:hypothetical protein